MGMLLASQIAAIIMLLLAFGVDPIITADVQRILEGRPTITSSTTITMTQPPAPAPNGINGVGTTEPPIAAAASAPASKARIDIISPTPKSGLGRKHTTSPELDEGGKGNPMNEMNIGAILYGDDGEAIRNAVMTITATDASQNKTIDGTGNVTPIYPNGQKNVVPFYSFHYEFKTVGEHTITFSSGGVSKSVTVTVSE